MNLKRIVGSVAIATMIALIVSAAFASGVHYSGLPKLNTLNFKAYPGAGPEAIVQEFLTGVTDWIAGPGRADLLAAVTSAGHKVSIFNNMSEFAFMAINCRDYKGVSGASNFPLNVSQFRVALSYIYGVNDKETDILTYAGGAWNFAIDNPVPPCQVPWYNPNVHMPNTDFDMAWAILQSVGFEVADGYLYCNGTKIRDLKVYFSTGALYWQEGPGKGFVRNFNDFMTYIGATNGPKATLLPTDFTTLVLELMVYHEYDFVCIGLTNLGRFVDYFYDLLHSENDVEYGWNFGGIHDPLFDEWSWTVLTSMDVNEVIEASWKIQERFVYEVMPWFPMGSAKAFCTTARDARGELMNVIPMEIYGPRNDWSFMAIHWKGQPGTVWPGGSATTALGDAPTNLNPFYENTLYGWNLLDRAIIGLIGIDPTDVTHDIPFVAVNWTIAHWVSIPELGITDGSMATFILRQDVKWHDLRPVTAYDCANLMRVLRKYKPGRYSSVWANLVYEEADGPYKFNVYFYTTSLYYAYYVAGTALMAPKHVMDVVENWIKTGVLPKLSSWTPAFKPYSELGLGSPPSQYSFMKQIVGCGPYVFDYYDKSLAVGRVQKFNEFFVNAPVIGAVVGEWRIDPRSSYTYKVLAQNIAAKEDSESGELVSVTFDVKVYEDDTLKYTVTDITLGPFKEIYLGPYTISSVPAGKHTIKVEIYESGNLIHTYEHTFVSTLRQDLNTYTGENLDFVVDIRDISRAGRAFGSSPGHLRWDPAADINKDFLVDIRDISSIGRKFGWHA